MSLTHCSWLLEGLLHAASCCIYWTGNLPLILLPLTQLQRMLHEQVFSARNGTACAVPHCCSAYRKLASCFADTVSVALCALCMSACTYSTLVCCMQCTVCCAFGGPLVAADDSNILQEESNRNQTCKLQLSRVPVGAGARPLV